MKVRWYLALRLPTSSAFTTLLRVNNDYGAALTPYGANDDRITNNNYQRRYNEYGARCCSHIHPPLPTFGKCYPALGNTCEKKYHREYIRRIKN